MKAQGIRTPALYIPRAGRQRPCVASGSFDQILALRFSRMTTVPPDLIAKPVGAPVGRDRHRVLPGGATPAETSHALERRYRRGKPSSTQSNRPGASCSNPEKRTPQRPRTIPPESKTPDACLFSISGSGELQPTNHVRGGIQSLVRIGDLDDTTVDVPQSHPKRRSRLGPLPLEPRPRSRVRSARVRHRGRTAKHDP